jgi:hypothetical protein
MVAVDFLVVPTIRFKMLNLFVALSHDRREVIHFNVTENQTAQWAVQQIAEAFPWDTAPKYLLRDRDKIWLVSFMDYDLGFFDEDEARVEPGENPFTTKVLPMSPAVRRLG